MNFWITALVSLGSGIAASMGLGGGFVLLIYLTIFAETPQVEAQWINLLFFLPIGTLALLLHLKNGLIEKSAILPALCWGAIGVMLGATAAHFLGNSWLRKIFAIFLLIVGCKELFYKKQPDTAEKP
jgi:uncharacterized membrane protein YfcA